MTSHAPSQSMYSPPISPYSLSPYPQDPDKSFNMVATELPTRQNYPQEKGSFYRSVSWILGFREKYSLINCFVWGGALVGFCLARSMAMNPALTAGTMPAGEWFSFHQPAYRVNLFIHIYLTTFGGIFAVFQFLPAIRRGKMILHRANGYGVLTCLVVGNISGAIVGRRAFGGELNVQAGYYTMGLLIVFSACMGLFYARRDTRRHRKWMMRMVVYFAAAVTARLIALAASQIISIIGTYYSVWTCAEVMDVLNNPQVVQSSYPQCTGIDPSAVYVTVLASAHAGPLYASSSLRAVHGMGLWIAILIHVVGVEIYLQKTETSNKVRHEFALHPFDPAEESTSR